MIIIGKIINTHGIKGEIKIKSDVDHKAKVFKKGNHLYVDNQKFTIKNYRIHKNLDMITFEEINDINDVLKYKGKDIYIDKNEIKNITLNVELIGFKAYQTDRYLGQIVSILKAKTYDILVIRKTDKNYYIPNIKEFVIKKDIENKKIYIREIEGLIYED